MSVTAVRMRSIKPGGAFSSDELEHRFATLVKFSLGHRLRFYRRMEKFVQRGRPLKTAINGMLERYERPSGLLKRPDPRRHIFARISRAISTDGDSFVTAFRPYAPASEMMMISSGFAGDKPEEGFRMAAYVAESSRAMFKAVAGRLVYPAILIAMALTMLVVLSGQLVPLMYQLKPDKTTWPGLSQLLANIADAIQGYGIWMGLGLIVTVVGVTMSLSRWRSKVRTQFFDKFVPFWMMYRAFQAASFLIALGAMVRTGRPLAAALAGLMENASPWLRSHLATMVTRVRAGDATWKALDTGMLDPETMGDLEDYSSSGAIDEALVIMGEDAIEHAIGRIKVISSILMGLALLSVAGVIMIIYGGFASFMFELSATNGPPGL